MIDGSDKLLMDHRNRQVDALVAENAALKSVVEKFTSTNQLKAEIAALIADYRGSNHSSEFQKKFESRIETLRQLSAV